MDGVRQAFAIAGDCAVYTPLTEAVNEPSAVTCSSAVRPAQRPAGGTYAGKPVRGEETEFAGSPSGYQVLIADNTSASSGETTSSPIDVGLRRRDLQQRHQFPCAGQPVLDQAVV
ncbi:hypothetical protein Acsp02_95120 [Actinoplanes sp. NBRC 103695]|nr:hypothetical protein Acsp02_95120 [Actinoplanes sp. NBRC 103695]